MTYYSFDTSSILNGRRDLFPPGTFPTLWTNIEEMISAGSIRCTDLVLDELGMREGDAIHQWAKAQSGLFLPLTEDLQLAVKTVLAQHPRLIGVGSGRSGADPFIIALAMVHNGTVVSEEIASGRIEKPKIPDVCDALGVPQVSLVRFLQEQEWVFR